MLVHQKQSPPLPLTCKPRNYYYHHHHPPPPSPTPFKHLSCQKRNSTGLAPTIFFGLEKTHHRLQRRSWCLLLPNFLNKRRDFRILKRLTYNFQVPRSYNPCYILSVINLLVSIWIIVIHHWCKENLSDLLNTLHKLF